MMLVCRSPQPSSLWESILPEPCQRLPAELAAVDRLLDDAAFFGPFRAHFHPLAGRPSIPLETYLRMMYLKFRWRLSYEDLCREVADSISWLRFCRIPLGGRVPHPTTLMKITRRCGPQTVAALNEALLAKADGERVVRLERVRADTTVVEANIAYPTDSRLLATAVALMVVLVAKIHATGGATRTRVRDRRRAAGRRARAIASKLKLRNDEAKAAVLHITGELATLATRTAADAEQVVRNARRKLRRAGGSRGLAALVEELDTAIARTRKVAAQTATRLAGDTPDSATRIVSLHDPDARPIAKGRLGRPVEFGYKAQVVDNADGIVVDHRVMIGNPPDAPLLVPAIRRIARRFGRAPRAVAADRGYGEAAIEQELKDLGVKTVAIPRKGKPGAARRSEEHRRGFRRLVKWRTGCEGRISHLKHGFGWERTRFDTIAGAETWCGWGVLAHNSRKISRLIDAKSRAGTRTPRRRPPPGSGGGLPSPTPATPTSAP